MEKNQKRDAIEINRVDLFSKLSPNRFVHLKSEKPLDKRDKKKEILGTKTRCKRQKKYVKGKSSKPSRKSSNRSTSRDKSTKLEPVTRNKTDHNNHDADDSSKYFQDVSCEEDEEESIRRTILKMKLNIAVLKCKHSKYVQVFNCSKGEIKQNKTYIGGRGQGSSLFNPKFSRVGGGRSKAEIRKLKLKEKYLQMCQGNNNIDVGEMEGSEGERGVKRGRDENDDSDNKNCKIRKVSNNDDSDVVRRVAQPTVTNNVSFDINSVDVTDDDLPSTSAEFVKSVTAIDSNNHISLKKDRKAEWRKKIKIKFRPLTKITILKILKKLDTSKKITS